MLPQVVFEGPEPFCSDKGETPWKLNFGYFQIQKSILIIVRAWKVDEKAGVICLV